ncbi:MBL fold metallo-hydrolase [Cupriavidus malaysiensis]|uniref:MBL fold metallo-hydrolase n=1 Tax=Cupriavidus malaysiensis TaxID=367825 RepID=A0ABN4TMZ9_9BURK|nr:MBL fold metallo-hydrolase [Cupriavidus malaysiensis]AOZ08594.1 MBL fold metallo-hydrolase [Cupriavidus malaysiensis]
MRIYRLLLAGVVALGVLPPGQADGEVTETRTGTHLITLGTRGGPIPARDRAQSSNLWIVDGTYYLVDAGDGVLRRLTQAGASFRQIGQVFITHGHDDHTAGLGTLMSVAWDFQRHDPIAVYGPPGTVALVKGAIQYFTVNAEIRWAEGRRTPLEDVFVGHDVAPGVVYQDKNIQVSAVENTHFHIPEGSPYYGKYKSYAYRFQTPDRVIVFTGDTGPSDAVTELARNADTLVTEVGSSEDVKQVLIRNGTWQSMTAQQQAAFMRHEVEEHLTPDEVGKMAARAKVRTVILTHLLPTVDEHDDYERYAAEVKKSFSGQVVVAKDLMEF